MQISSLASLLPAVFGAASIALFSPVFSSSAHAYSVMLNGRTAGNPGGALYDVNVNSTYDIGRQLDPVQWLVPAGTKGDTVLPVDLTARADITIQNLTSNLLELAITLTNTTIASYQSSIVSFGFGVSPDATSVTLVQKGVETQVFNQASIQNGQQQFTGGFKKIDICIYAANGCSGGDVKQGLQSGQFDTFVLKIAGNFGSNPSSVTLSDFPLKFQTAAGSFEPAGVPEPLTVAGSGLALGFGALLKKQAAKKRSKEDVKS